MQRHSFWLLVDLVTPVWSGEYAKRPAHPIYQQLAVGLYMLESAGLGLERARGMSG